ncbi:hypothetical protein IMCC21906_00473 [Spongiibacter sp. IMCC21906]|uniref:hypothetical protein n=1 Tax=Spongiibacter sp. IMCC21906 TaxID=1620392 RepID=UPI00062DEC0C|nr:hypothetical protein [Spongiibacter sp. IMCC21906]AKH68166.1 hypothetical protein IMCC21906_00473 [Spongiibacter sp. IMCC21906]
MNASWEPWHKQLDEPTLYGLQFAADQLSRSSGKTALPGKDIESLQSELEQLLDNVIGSDIPQGLKALFLRNLESIRHSVLVYRIKGIDGLEEELERAVGFLVLNRQDIPAEGDPSESRKYWEKFFSLVDRINQLVALGRGVKELSGPAMHAISHILGK